MKITYTVTLKNKEVRPLLRGISGWCRPGTLTALMGASGAGASEEGRGDKGECSHSLAPLAPVRLGKGGETGGRRLIGASRSVASDDGRGDVGSWARRLHSRGRPFAPNARILPRAGKTTLMDAVAFRKTEGRLGGSVFLNGVKAEPVAMARIAGASDEGRGDQRLL